MSALADAGVDVLLRASRSRDARFDGRFVVGVASTGTYCRPSCSAPAPKGENVRFHATPEDARAAGLRACRRCRPDEPPGSEQLVVGRALAAESATSRPAALAVAAGVSESRLRTLVVRYLAVTPSELLRQLRAGEGLALKLEYREPFPLADCLDYLGRRGFRGVEEVSGDVYRRTFRARGGPGMLELGPADDGHVAATITGAQPDELPAIVAGARRTLDLDADPAVVDADLAGDPRLSSTVRLKPGLRLTGAFDPFELAVRAILGQQVSVSAASTLAGRLAATFGDRLSAPYSRGDLGILFPEAKALAHADLSAIGISEARAAAISSLAAAVTRDPGLLRATGSVENVVARLTALPGIGEWTAHYIAMRALREPDAFPASDLGLLRALRGRLQRRADRWRPWRAYAAMLLWLDGAVVEAPSRPSGRRSLDAQSGPETAGTLPGAVPGFSPCHITGGSCSACPRPSTASPGGRGPALRSSSLRSSKSSRGDAVPRRSATR
jgi:AraC family transcriptional regulator of adaptative response / DNA-3-methyladenine glycosylase II